MWSRSSATQEPDDRGPSASTEDAVRNRRLPHAFPLSPVASTLLLSTLLLLLLPAPAWADIWEITTYGNGPLLASAFKGIALFGSQGMGSAIKLAALVGLLGLLVACMGFVVSNMRKTIILETLIVAAVVTTLSQHKVEVGIVDKVAATSTVIADVPLPIAAIGYMTSTLGEQLAEKVETAIQPVDFERFTQTGLGWGPKVLKSTLQVSLLDQGLLNDLDGFIRLCMMPDVNSGYATVEKITTALTVDDILGDTNPAIPVLLPSQCDSQGLPAGCTPAPTDQRCPDAYTDYLRPKLNQAAQDQNLLKTLASQMGLQNPNDVIPAITNVSQELLGVSQDGTELLKLRFVANQFLPSVQAYAALGGQSALLTAWSLSEAQAQQTSAWLNTGLLLQQTLPIFHAALQFLFYGFLVVGIPLTIVMPRMFRHILANALWLELWPLAYVFGNTFLYQQAANAGFYSSSTGLNWGLSMAATRPLTNSFDFAYAASGFPVLIGVTMLAGMVFGGSYGVHKAISEGPWHAGGSFGTAAALGNVRTGDMALEQRQLAPTTERIAPDVSGRSAIETTRAWPEQQAVQEFRGPSGSDTILGGGDGVAYELALPGRTMEATASPTGFFASSRVFDVAGSSQQQASHTRQYQESRARTETAGIRLAESASQTTAEVERLSQDVVTRTGDQAVHAASSEVTRSHQQVVETAAREAGVYTELQRQATDKGTSLHGGLGFEWRGLGAGGQADITVRDAHGKESILTLTGDQARRFAVAYGHQVAGSDQWRHSVESAQATLRDRGVSSDFQTAQQRLSDYQTATRTEKNAGEQLHASQQAGRMAQRNEFPEFLAFQWQEQGYPGSIADARLTPMGRMELRDFVEKEAAIIQEGGTQFQDQLREYEAAHPGKDLVSTRTAILLGAEEIGSPQHTVTAPGSREEFRGQHGPAPASVDTHTTEHQVQRGLAGAPGATDRHRADEAVGRTKGTPSMDGMETRREGDKGRAGVVDRSVTERTKEATGKTLQGAGHAAESALSWWVHGAIESPDPRWSDTSSPPDRTYRGD